MYDTHEAVSILFASAHKPPVFLCVLAHSNGRQLLSSFAKLGLKSIEMDEINTLGIARSLRKDSYNNFAHKAA